MLAQNDTVVKSPISNGSEWTFIIDDVEYIFRNQMTAWEAYTEILRIRREHIERNPTNLPIGSSPEPAEWVSCPNCGQVYDEYESCPACDVIPFMGEPGVGNEGTF